MTDVFVSYAHQDKEMAARIAELLERHGYLVWWDQRISVGDRFDKEIELQLRKASAVVVLWSRYSIESNWVREEAAMAVETGALIPVRIHNADPPPPHRLTKTLDLTKWDRNPDAEEFRDLINSIEGKRLASRSMFMAVVADRAKGKSRVAITLAKIAEVQGTYSDLARLELAYHEYARLGESKALRIVGRIAELATDPFVVRGLCFLQAVCYLSAGEKMEAARLIEKAPPRVVLSQEQNVSISLYEILVYGTLDDSSRLEDSWRDLSDAQSFEPRAGYQIGDLARKFDRALISIIYGKDPVADVLSGLPVREYKGLAHLAAANSRAVRKSPIILQAIESRGRREGWKQPNDVITMRRRCRTFELSLLPEAGTLFGPESPNGRYNGPIAQVV